MHIVILSLVDLTLALTIVSVTFIVGMRRKILFRPQMFDAAGER